MARCRRKLFFSYFLPCSNACLHLARSPPAFHPQLRDTAAAPAAAAAAPAPDPAPSYVPMEVVPPATPKGPRGFDAMLMSPVYLVAVRTARRVRSRRRLARGCHN